jgi:hypothetical protein
VQFFSQADVLEDRIIILDVWSEVYIWVGANTPPIEKAIAKKVVERYHARVEDGRPENVPVHEILSGFETGLFKAHFPFWNTKPALEQGVRDYCDFH